MPPLPDHQPKQLSLGTLESEILDIIWELGTATAKDILTRILSDPDRELAYASVMTVLTRLTHKGWLKAQKQGKTFLWQPLVSKQEAQALQAYKQLHKFLEIGNAEIVAAFADQLDRASITELEAIAAKLKAIRQAREEK